MADTTTLGPAGKPAVPHDRNHAHDGGRHDHVHAPGEEAHDHPAPRRAAPTRSLVALSGLQRLALAAPAIAALWLLAFWAVL
jgi:hypothetical protein